MPELVFGHLLTSDNYNDSEKKAGLGGGGQSGIGDVKVLYEFPVRLFTKHNLFMIQVVVQDPKGTIVRREKAAGYCSSQSPLQSSFESISESTNGSDKCQLFL